MPMIVLRGIYIIQHLYSLVFTNQPPPPLPLHPALASNPHYILSITSLSPTPLSPIDLVSLTLVSIHT